MVAYLLHNLEPELFPEETPEDAWYKGFELSLLCFALRAPLDALLPTETHEIDNTVTALSAVINQQYRAIGKPLSVPRKTPQVLLQGYYPQADNTVTCVLDQKPDKTVVEFSYAQGVNIKNPLPDRHRRCPHGGRP